MAKKPKKKPVRKQSRRQRKQPEGIGMSGGTTKITPSEERAIARGLSGKADMSTQKKHVAEISKEQAASGEKKSSYTQRMKGKTTVLDLATGKRKVVKAKPSAAKKAALKKQAANVKAGKRAAKKVQKKKR